MYSNVEIFAYTHNTLYDGMNENTHEEDKKSKFIQNISLGFSFRQSLDFHLSFTWLCFSFTLYIKCVCSKSYTTSTIIITGTCPIML